MDLSSNPWKLYPSDAPGVVGFRRPGDKGVAGPVGIRRIRWFQASDERIPPGSGAHIEDENGNDVFRAIWPDDDGAVAQMEVDVGHVYTGLVLTTLTAGELEIYVE